MHRNNNIRNYIIYVCVIIPSAAVGYPTTINNYFFDVLLNIHIYHHQSVSIRRTWRFRLIISSRHHIVELLLLQKCILIYHPQSIYTTVYKRHTFSYTLSLLRSSSTSSYIIVAHVTMCHFGDVNAAVALCRRCYVSAILFDSVSVWRNIYAVVIFWSSGIDVVNGNAIFFIIAAKLPNCTGNSRPKRF
jgi:hypothetical protein